MSARIAHDAIVGDRAFGVAFDFVAFFDRMYGEADPVLIVLLEDLVVGGMETGCPRSGVDLGFDARNAYLGKGDPFAPSNGEK